MSILPLPPSGVAFIDPITGGVSVQWQNYLLSLSTLGGGFAPIDAEYWVSTSNSELTNETNLGALTSGYMKLTVAAAVGTPSTVATIPGTDITGSALTKTDDTNVTLTLGGSSATALLRAASLTLGWAGTLAHGRGGTDVTSPGSSGNLLTSNGTNWTSAAPASSGTVTSVGFLSPGGIFGQTGTPVTTAGTLTETVTGTSGGVPYFSTTSNLASSGSLTSHGVVIGGGSGTAPTSTTAGTTGQALLSNGASSDPTFQTLSLPLAARLTANFTSNTNTLADVSDLTVNVLASTNYTYQATLFFNADSTGGIKIGLAGSATLNSLRMSVMAWNLASAGTGLIATKFANATLASNSTSGSGGGFNNSVLFLQGSIAVANAGTVKMQFAQSTPSSSSTLEINSNVSLLPSSD